MKTFNYVVLSLFLFTFLFSSCSEDISPNQNVPSKEDAGFILLPSDIMSQDKAVINNYIENLTPEKSTIHQNAYISKNYLEELNLANHFIGHIINADFQNADYSKFLDQSQIDELENQLLSNNVVEGELDSRATCCGYYYAPYCREVEGGYFCCCGDYVYHCYYCQGSNGPR